MSILSDVSLYPFYVRVVDGGNTCGGVFIIQSKVKPTTKWKKDRILDQFL